MKQWLITRTKKLFENIESTITTVFVLAFFGGAIGLLALSKKALDVFLQILNTPTPLWAATALVLLVICYIKIATPKLPLKNKISWVKIGTHKWKVLIMPDGTYRINEIPFCIKHDLQVTDNVDGKYFCPHMGESCENNINKIKIDALLGIVKSHAEKLIRDKKYS